MTRKSQITQDALLVLGAVKLAQLVLDESERSAGFRRQVSAALAGQNGPQAIAKLIDRRLGALEKARSYVEWNKARAFRDDLAATVATITRQLGEVAPALAIDRLLRFIATHEVAFERVDDSSGYVEDVYSGAIEDLGGLTSQLSPDELALMPDRIAAALGQSDHGYFVDAARAVAGHLPPPVLRGWDIDLAKQYAELESRDAKSTDRFIYSNVSQYLVVRQIVADALGDLDGFIVLESRKHPNMQDTLGVAQRLLEADRAREALDWVRREAPVKLRFMSRTDIADHQVSRDVLAPQRASLEATILDKLGETDAAQALRWSVFEESLNMSMLRDYVARLPDFEDFDALDKAFDYVLTSKHIYSALDFLLAWPRLDLAARLVVKHFGTWDGRHYDLLPQAAAALENSEHETGAVAAAILYRALIDDILTRGNSKAYPHAARYLNALDALAARSDAEAVQVGNMDVHVTYRARLQKNHGRKYGFWGLLPQACR
ncbi:DUF6880 family protein [Asticcacaulis benevestitus]|uniref:Uncharacterized protein n=1 Tax=Asticcacaulis benevestitus DSM 16100 = ATCC BAA-896 TaxID=1121022 RepID=V4PTC5_9CAUL|nr:DUF6880 family protein [Asticcacaulis benevestitus]ESQ88805.1 hypothetical protein ABENE_14955 [Asticcacaulis benevestitus DSM 16100 = ATCC BAA-896]